MARTEKLREGTDKGFAKVCLCFQELVGNLGTGVERAIPNPEAQGHLLNVKARPVGEAAAYQRHKATRDGAKHTKGLYRHRHQVLAILGHLDQHVKRKEPHPGAHRQPFTQDAPDRRARRETHKRVAKKKVHLWWRCCRPRCRPSPTATMVVAVGSEFERLEQGRKDVGRDAVGVADIAQEGVEEGNPVQVHVIERIRRAPIGTPPFRQRRHNFLHAVVSPELDLALAAGAQADQLHQRGPSQGGRLVDALHGKGNIIEETLSGSTLLHNDGVENRPRSCGKGPVVIEKVKL